MSRYHRFIPVRKAELVRGLKSDLQLKAEKARQFDVFVDLLKDLFRHGFERTLEEIRECYYPFNPDRDTVTLEELTDEELLSRRARLCELFAEVMNVANCERLSKEQFEAYVAQKSIFDVDVRIDASEYDELMVFYRGEVQRTFQRRTVRRMFREENVLVDCFQRLVIVLKTKDDPHVYIKLFKEVPSNALETLLPKLEIRMRLTDKLKLGGSGLAGVVGASLRMGTGTLKYFRSLTLASGIAILAAGFYGLRTFLGFRKVRESYVADLAKRLYFNNLDNNLGVIRCVVDMALEEEVEEALLAWYVLARARGPVPVEDVKKGAEDYLRREYGVDVDFEVNDAIGKLVDRGIVDETGAGLLALPLDVALKRLGGRWDALYEA